MLLLQEECVISVMKVRSLLLRDGSNRLGYMVVEEEVGQVRARGLGCSI